MRRLGAGLVIGLALALSGCVQLFDDGPEVDPYVAQFTATVAGISTVVVDAQASRADRYIWDFGDGKGIAGGPETAVVSHTYDKRDVYVIILICEWNTGTSGGGSADDGCCGPPPGPGGGGGGSTPSGEPTIRTAYRIVDMTGGENTLKPILITLNGWGGVADSFYPGQKVCLWAGESVGENLWYQMEIVRVVSEDDPTPIPYCWQESELGGIICEPEIRYIRTEEKSFCWYIAGPSHCSGETWTFRVTLWVSDAYGRRASTTKFIHSGCCP